MDTLSLLFTIFWPKKVRKFVYFCGRHQVCIFSSFLCSFLPFDFPGILILFVKENNSKGYHWFRRWQGILEFILDGFLLFWIHFFDKVMVTFCSKRVFLLSLKIRLPSDNTLDFSRQKSDEIKKAKFWFFST